MYCMYVCLHVRTYYVGIYLSWRGEGIYIRMLARKVRSVIRLVVALGRYTGRLVR